MNNLRVAILCYPTFGGSGVIATELAHALACRGHTVHLLSYASPSRLRTYTPNLRFHLVQVSSYPLFKYPSYDLALAAQIIDIAENEGLDIVHAHYAIPHSISSILAARVCEDHPFRVITTLHGTDITLIGSERSYVPLIRFALRRSDAVTAVSEFLKSETVSIFGNGYDIRLIPNFIDTELFRPRIPSRDPFASPTLAHISNFRPVKRTMDLIHVFANVRERIDARLLLIGDGPELTCVQQLASKLGLTRHISFLGQQTDIVAILEHADLFLLTSETESFGLSALEALGCGVPAVCTRVGGVSEVIEHERSGILCELGNISEMADACVAVLMDPPRYRAMRLHARERAMLFRTENIVPQYLDLYSELMESNS